MKVIADATALQTRPGQYLTFDIQGRPYAVAIEFVREINRMIDISPVPGSPHFLAGIINLRGKVIPVVNLGLRFGFASTDATRATCIIVVATSSGLIGIIVDSVSEVLTLESHQIESVPNLIGADGSKWITSVGKIDGKVLMMIDIFKILGDASQLANLEQQAG